MFNTFKGFFVKTENEDESKKEKEAGFKME